MIHTACQRTSDMKQSCLWVVAFVAAVSTNAVGAELPTFIDPSDAGPDFLVQGEYVGKVGGEIDVGVQLIALGNRAFQGVLYTGGLPGAGWDEGQVFHVRGKTDGDRATFEGIHGERLNFPNANFRGSIQDGVFGGKALMFRGRTEDVSFRLTKANRKSPTLGAKPPENAIVLFDGTNTAEWDNGKRVEERLLGVGTTSKRNFGSVFIHMEFRCPFMPTARGMQRGNSGIYVKNEWEVQIIDSFAWHHENRKFERLSKFGRCGGIHEMVAPRINMSFPPLSWQTYDIDFVMAKYDDAGKKLSPALMTVKHNGILIHDRYVVPPVPPGRPLAQTQERQRGPIFLQDHGNPVRFRNIWVIERD